MDDKIENNEIKVKKIKEILKLFAHKIVQESSIKIDLKSIISEKKNRIQIPTEVYSVINTGELVIQSTHFSKEIAQNIVGKYKIVDKNNFAYNPSRINIGSIGLMENRVGCVSPIYIVFSIKLEYVHFFKELLNFDFMKKEIEKRCSGSVRQALSFEDMCRIQIPQVTDDTLHIFNLKYEVLNTFIIKIKNENRKLEELKQLYLKKFFG